MPWDRRRYPPEWEEIRARILDRAGARCEYPGCRAPNHALGAWQGEAFLVYDEAQAEAAALDGERVIRIILTVAHLDNPDPLDCREENLAAYCQRHHNRHDAAARARHAAETRAERRRALGQLALEEEPS